MPEVSIDVAGRSYRVGCGEGEEAHLARLAERIDAEATGLARKMGQMTEGRLMLLAALMVADKLHETEIALVESNPATAEMEKNLKSTTAKMKAAEERAAEAENSTAEAAKALSEATDKASSLDAALKKAEEAVAKADARAADAEEKAKAAIEMAAEAENDVAMDPAREVEIARTLDALADRIEALAGRVEVPA